MYVCQYVACSIAVFAQIEEDDDDDDDDDDEDDDGTIQSPLCLNPDLDPAQKIRASLGMMYLAVFTLALCFLVMNSTPIPYTSSYVFLLYMYG